MWRRPKYPPLLEPEDQPPGGLVGAFIRWAVSHSPYAQPVVTFGAGDYLFDRYEFFRKDEATDGQWDSRRPKPKTRPYALPWWLPFNAMLHCWKPTGGYQEAFHDHPRWSITVCLVGRIVEVTPWWVRELRSGSIVIRSRKAIHAFRVPEGHAGPIWTLFIVGRRVARQNTYVVTAR